MLEVLGYVSRRDVELGHMTPDSDCRNTRIRSGRSSVLLEIGVRFHSGRASDASFRKANIGVEDHRVKVSVV